MNLLALDQSSHVSGYAIFKDGKLDSYGKFSVDDESVDKRLVKIRKWLADLILNNQIDEVVYEDIQQQSNVANNVKTFKVLAEVYGTISEYLEEQGIPHSSVLASSWKSTLGIKGRTRQEQKKNAQQFVIDKYSVKVVQDIADAICIGEHHLSHSHGAW